jgi:hypothetical protein
MPAISWVFPTSLEIENGTTRMTRVVESVLVDADVDSVWSMVRDFAAVGRWIPSARSCEIVEGVDQNVPVRRIVLGDDSSVDERLVTLDDIELRIRYEIIAPLPKGMRSFLGTARVVPVTEGKRSVVEWMSEFDCDGAIETRIVENVSRLLRGLLKALQLEASPAADREGT